ncbi:ribosomal RNA small subunit methyltransferase A [bacterium]|nr:ribosomal RNA small subunit methyltransferase A [bacterium]
MIHRRPYARKRFGQHFLQDNNVLNNIVSAANICPDDHIIEIGPGRGALTRKLLESGAMISVIEIDRDLAGDLQKEFSKHSNFEIITADILQIDWDEILSKTKANKIIANLPYNISTPLFFKFIRWRDQLKSITVMVQKEVAERLCHNGEGKKLKDYGVLSVISTLVFSSRLLFKVPPTCFIPEPKVDSAVIQLETKDIVLRDEEGFFKFVQRAFNLRRKLLSTFLRKNESALYDQLSQTDKQHLENLRPENILPSQYLNLYYKRRILD